MIHVPEGFQPHTRKSGFTAPWEPIYHRPHDNGISLGVHAREAHANSRGFVHGGLLSALCDNAMGLSCLPHLEDSTLPPLKGRGKRFWRDVSKYDEKQSEIRMLQNA